MYLVEKRADVNLKDDEHHTALHLSCQVLLLLLLSIVVEMVLCRKFQAAQKYNFIFPSVFVVVDFAVV